MCHLRYCIGGCFHWLWLIQTKVWSRFDLTCPACSSAWQLSSGGFSSAAPSDALGKPTPQQSLHTRAGAAQAHPRIWLKRPDHVALASWKHAHSDTSVMKYIFMYSKLHSKPTCIVVYGYLSMRLKPRFPSIWLFRVLMSVYKSTSLIKL